MDLNKCGTEPSGALTVVSQCLAVEPTPCRAHLHVICVSQPFLLSLTFLVTLRSTYIAAKSTNLDRVRHGPHSRRPVVLAQNTIRQPTGDQDPPGAAARDKNDRLRAGWHDKHEEESCHHRCGQTRRGLDR